jgi:transketolase
LFKLALATSAEFDKMSQHNIPAHLNDLRRHQIIDRIRDFFLENKIEVTSENLLTVHAAYSGESPRLARKFSVMREENRPITQAWLDHITQNDEDIAQRDNAQQILNRLSSRLEVFTSAAARALTTRAPITPRLNMWSAFCPRMTKGTLSPVWPN